MAKAPAKKPARKAPAKPRSSVPRRRKLSNEQVRDAYRRTFGSESGQIVLDDLLRAFMNRSSYVPGDPYGTHFKEGRREVVLRIQFMLDVETRAQDIVETDQEA